MKILVYNKYLEYKIEIKGLTKQQSIEIPTAALSEKNTNKSEYFT